MLTTSQGHGEVPAPSSVAVKVIPARYPLLLGIFTLLFTLRVLGQALVAIHHVGFLPPFEQWQSGLLPYPLLLGAQIGLIVLMAGIVRNFVRGEGYFTELRPRTGTALKALGGIYFIVMIVRYGVTMTLYPELRWFTGTIPIWFHFVLAAFLSTLGHYQVCRAFLSARAPSP